eukprot:CAMPEP_0206481464 /NCGR_PEP_ID=MMETSP0324_2-20121206/38155_2 /ASSEMBLY_ACC=CAM_ASM_000836 /TAXON_ID=2866 /ORGANISM="Crypthecodinium cohnii, Strain Seligo" /LENGTH=92 /DNA_ID=CAMNT_0053958947 /DNA_START=343 /DNA_END=617 /DNA_ORIENTATION=-
MLTLTLTLIPPPSSSCLFPLPPLVASLWLLVMEKRHEREHTQVNAVLSSADTSAETELAPMVLRDAGKLLRSGRVGQTTTTVCRLPSASSAA